MTAEGPISQRTIDTLKRKQALESHFAEDFSSLTYPMLADLYYNEGDLDRAKKVCSIGLDHHPSHAPGLFLMAKILVKAGDLPGAEKWLDSALDGDNTHLEAAELAVAIKERLKRKSSVLEEAYRRLIAANPLSRAAHVRLNRIVAERELVRTVKEKMSAKAAGAEMPEIELPKQFTAVPVPDSTAAINADFEIRALDTPEVPEPTAKLGAELDWEENIKMAAATLDEKEPSISPGVDEVILSDDATGDEPTTVAEVLAAERSIVGGEAGTVESVPVMDEATEQIITEEESPGEPSEIATALAEERSAQEAAAFEGSIEDLDLTPPEPTIPLDDLLPLTFEGGIDPSQADLAEETLMAAIGTEDEISTEDIEAETVTDESIIDMGGDEPQVVAEDSTIDEAMESRGRGDAKVLFPGTSTADATVSERDDELTVAADMDEKKLDDQSSIAVDVESEEAEAVEDTDLVNAKLAALEDIATEADASIDDVETEATADELPEPAEIGKEEMADLSEIAAEAVPATADELPEPADLDEAEPAELSELAAEDLSESEPVIDEGPDDAELAELDSITAEIDASLEDAESEAKVDELPEPAEIDEEEMADLSEIAAETVPATADELPEPADLDEAELAELSDLTAEDDVVTEPVEETIAEEPANTPIQRANMDDAEDSVLTAVPDAEDTKPAVLTEPEPEAESAVETGLESGPFGVKQRDKVQDLVSEITGNEPRDEAVIKATKKAEETERKGKLQIDPQLATFTLATIYKVQGLYQQALNVLTMIEEKGGDARRIAEERESIGSLMSKGFRPD